ncbi:MAG TPA: hypothetical protein DFS52_13985 [Myxococcales bacterium]|nr:hypothetical protein [Myxococcales bacterium]
MRIPAACLLAPFALLALGSGCATRAVVPDRPAPLDSPAAVDSALGGEIAKEAARYVGGPFGGDCSGFVKHVLAEVGVVLPLPARARTGSEALMLATRPTTRPRAGDLAFFHDTYDRNRDGRVNDPYSHVAIVESVEGAQLTLIHRGGKGIARLRMDLSRPSDRERNSVLRVRRRDDPPGLRYLAGELSAGFGVVVPVEELRVARRSLPALCLR